MTALEWADSLTVLHALGGSRMAKSIAADGAVQDFDGAYRFNAFRCSVACLDDVRALLHRLMPSPHCCVVRGEPIGETRAIRRLAYADAETGDQPTLRDVPRRWLALDADGIDRPLGTAPEDLLACGDAVIDRLPPAFQQAACLVQASAGHGIKPGIRLRLWYWCDRPMRGAELARWLKGTPVDASVFRTVQAIFTAAPVFLGGRIDHLPCRLVQWPGEAWLRCPDAAELAPPPRQVPPPPERIATGTPADAYSRAALIRAADAILNAGEGNRHSTIVSESRSLARLVKAGLLPEQDLISVITCAAANAGKTDGREVASMIAWALTNPSNGTLPEVRHAA